MLDSQILLDVVHYNGSTNTDLKSTLGDPSSDTATITLDTDNYIYVGFYKPFGEVYFDFSTANTNDNTITAEYYSDSAGDWTSIDIIDETNGFKRSGFIHWNRPDDEDWEETTYNSEELYWIRFATSATQSETVYNYAGIVFSDDKSLALYNPYINDTSMLMGQSNHLKIHIAARNQIVQRLVKGGHVKYNTLGNRVRLTGWDFLDKNEIKDAAAYLALSMIYFNLSDNPDDSWQFKSNKYEQLFEQLFNTVIISIDINDDGEIGENERSAVISRHVRR